MLQIQKDKAFTTKTLLAALVLGLSLVGGQAFADSRLVDGLLGAGAGALVGGPIGLVAGGVIGYSAGPQFPAACTAAAGAIPTADNYR